MSQLDTRYSWLRLFISLLIAVIGNVGMWAIVVMPDFQSEMGLDRADASLPYTFTMIGFAVGNYAIGRMVDRCLFIGGCHFELGRLLRGNTHIIPVGHLFLSTAFGFWNCGNLWAIDRRCVEMVSKAAQYRGRNRGQWELFIGCDMAAFADRCAAHIGMAWGVSMAGGINTHHYGAIVPSAVPPSERSIHRTFRCAIKQ